MRAAVSLPVTVKHRIGVDELDRYEDMANFVSTVAVSGCDRFTVHARKAWLNGLSPKDNRTIPPLRYGDVHRLKAEFPELTIEINGGLTNLDDAQVQLGQVDAVMVGRAAYEDPFTFAAADERLFDDPGPRPNRYEVIERMLPYIRQAMADGAKLQYISRHLLNLFRGCRGGRVWRRTLSENAWRADADWRLIESALAALPREPSAQPGAHRVGAG